MLFVPLLPCAIYSGVFDFISFCSIRRFVQGGVCSCYPFWGLATGAGDALNDENSEPSLPEDDNIVEGTNNPDI